MEAQNIFPNLFFFFFWGIKPDPHHYSQTLTSIRGKRKTEHDLRENNQKTSSNFHNHRKIQTSQTGQEKEKGLDPHYYS